MLTQRDRVTGEALVGDRDHTASQRWSSQASFVNVKGAKCRLLMGQTIFEKLAMTC